MATMLRKLHSTPGLIAGLLFLIVALVLFNEALGAILASGELAPVASRARLGLARLAVFLLILSAFNLLNLLPMHRFDGGQVLRQLFAGRTMRALATFTVTSAIAWMGWRVGFSPMMVIAGLCVFTLMSLIRMRSVKPRLELEPMTQQQRLLTGFGFCAALANHAGGVIHACDRLFAPVPF